MWSIDFHIELEGGFCQFASTTPNMQFLMFLLYTEFENLLCDEMSQNVVETTIMTERHLQQAAGSKLQGEEQNLSTDVLEKLGIDLQDHPSDLPVNTMLRGAAS
jgi:hypothetical protein